MYIVSAYIEDIGEIVCGGFYRDFSGVEKLNKYSGITQYILWKEVAFILAIREI